MGFSLVLTSIILVGVALIAVSKEDEGGASAIGPDIGEHWHAVVGLNICGAWQPDIPAYESAKGIHSHGDGFMHMHPTGSAGANENSTVGLYLEQADYEVTGESIKIPDQKIRKNGDKCKELDNQPSGLRWSVNGEEKPLKSDPAEYVPSDGDVIAIAFLPQKTPIGTPPTAEKGETPSDVNVPSSPTTVPAGDSPTTTAPAGDGATTTTAPNGSTTTTAGDSDTTTTTGGE